MIVKLTLSSVHRRRQPAPSLAVHISLFFIQGKKKKIESKTQKTLVNLGSWLKAIRTLGWFKSLAIRGLTVLTYGSTWCGVPYPPSSLLFFLYLSYLSFCSLSLPSLSKAAFLPFLNFIFLSGSDWCFSLCLGFDLWLVWSCELIRSCELMDMGYVCLSSLLYLACYFIDRRFPFLSFFIIFFSESIL